MPETNGAHPITPQTIPVIAQRGDNEMRFQGLSKREHTAIEIAKALYSSPEVYQQLRSAVSGYSESATIEIIIDRVTRIAVLSTDALMAKLNEGQEGY